LELSDDISNAELQKLTRHVLFCVCEIVIATWQPAQGDPSKIENGKVVGETLTFSFSRNTHPINATGHLSGDTISFDITGHKWGMSKTVHRTATRIALN
jgi:hypothetical protein